MQFEINEIYFKRRFYVFTFRLVRCQLPHMLVTNLNFSHLRKDHQITILVKNTVCATKWNCSSQIKSCVRALYDYVCTKEMCTNSVSSHFVVKEPKKKRHHWMTIGTASIAWAIILLFLFVLFQSIAICKPIKIKQYWLKSFKVKPENVVTWNDFRNIG